MDIAQHIAGFLAQKRIAVVGVSRNPRHFSRGLFRQLIKQGYEAVPVNPSTDAVEGLKTFPRLQDIVPPVEAALILTPRHVTDQILQDCIESGISRIWIHGVGGRGAVNPEAVARCKEKGISVVPGYCLYMFLPHTGFIHRLHGWVSKRLGSYPRSS